MALLVQSHFLNFRPQISTRGGSGPKRRVRIISGSTALVTGASGYLGARLCHELVNQGYSVKAFDLETSDTSSLTGGESLQIVYGDVTDYASLRDAASGCHVIFHVAAVVDQWIPDPSRYFSVNVGGLKNVVKAYKESNTVEKIIYTSSFVALGSTLNGQLGDENQVHHGKYFSTEYEKSKFIADKRALEAAAEGVPLVPVYPGVIYGPGNTTNLVTKLVIERFNGRMPGYFGQDMNAASFSYIDDVAKGHVAAMIKGRPGERYLLTGENASFKHFLDLAAEMSHTPKPLFRIPLIVLEAVGWLCIIFYRITGKPPLTTPPVVKMLKHEWAYSCDKAKKELDYNPTSLRQGVMELLSWLNDLGLIKY